MEVKDFIAEYNKNGTKNLVHTKAEVSKPGALDSKEIANFFVEKVGGADSFAKHYSQWGREYNETQKQISGIQDGYSSKDVMKDAAQKLRNLAASGSIYNYVNTTLGGKGTPNFAESLNKQINALEERSEFYSQWATEEEYKEALKAQEDYEKSLNLNTEAAERDIGYYEKELNAINTVEAEIRKLQSEQQTLKLAKAKGSKDASAKLEENQKRLATLNESLEKAWGTYGSKEKLESFISQKKAYTTQAKRLQAGVALTNEALNAEDFGKYNAPNAEIANEDLTYKYINDVDGYRQEITSWYANNSGYTSDTGITYPNVKPKFLELNFEHMNDEEISIYNYYYSKFGAEKANEYLDLLQETLNTRSASKIREDYDTDLKRMLFAVAAGFDQFESGVENLFNFSDDYIVSSDTQIASGMIREDLKDSGAKLPDWMGGGPLGQAGYDLITTTTNMAPSILTSAVVGMINPVAGQIVGAGLMGASASGNAYAEALNLGYDKSQARTYSVLVGASEAGLQYLLGGIGAMGGALTGKASTKIATKLASNVDKAFGKMLVSGGTKLVGNMISEFGEEYLQEVLTPVFKNIALKTEEDVKLVSPEAFYAGFLGALSAGVLESGGTVAGEVGTYNSGKSVMEKGKTNDLVNLGKSFSTDTIAYQIASKIDGNTDAYTLGQLLNEAGAGSLTESNMAEIQKSLERKGVTPQDAQTIAKWLNKAVEGRYFTNSQIEALSQNEVISATFRDVILNQKSTVNQRVQRYQDILESLEQENANSTEATATPANVDATVGAVNDTVSGTATEDVSNAYTPTSKVDENGRPITVDLKTKQPVLNEPNLTDTSGPNTYLAEDADKKPFLHNDEHTRVENIAEKLGMELRWSSKIGQEGKYVGGVIYLDPHCADPLLQVYKHEFTHWLENSRWYKSFVAYLKSTQVYKTWIEEYHGGEEAYSAEIKKDYEAAGLKYDVTHEIVANFVAERVLGGIAGFEYDANGRLVNRDPIVEEALTKFAETHQTWYDAILTHIKDIIASIKNLYYKVTGKDATQQPQSEELKEIYRRLVQLKDTVNTKKAAQADGQFMISEKFEKQIDAWDRKTVGFSFVVGETSEALQKAGVPKKKIRWDATKIVDSLKKHNSGMDIDVIKLVPNILEHPIVVVDSKTVPGRKVVLGEEYDNNGKLIVVALELNPSSKSGKTQYHDIVKIATSQGRSHIQSLINGNICYVDPDKKRVQNWLNVNKLQLPLRSTNMNSTTIITNSSQKVKQKQFDIIQATNPMWDDYHTGIRSVEDIRTWEEVLQLDDEREGQFVWGDFSREDAEKALKENSITVYSSYPIENGVFVSTSYIQAEQYASGGNAEVYSAIVPLNEVAWINGDEGQYAKIDEADTDTTTKQDGQAYVSTSQNSDLLQQYKSGEITREQYQAELAARNGNYVTDADYMEAVNRGDMETAQSIVYEAAKEAGYPQRLFHGTDQFGYTKFEGTEGHSYDEIQYFATDSLETASSYAYLSPEVRRISSTQGVDLEAEAKKHASDMASFMSKEIGDDNYINRETIMKAAASEEDFALRKICYQWLKDVYESKYSKEYKNRFKKRYKSQEDFASSDKAKQLKTEALKLGRLVKDSYDSRALGIYEFVANTDNLFVLDGKGKQWNELEDSRLPENRQYKTREVCEWAKEKGYSGVLFKNIIDSGLKVAEVSPANVYAFFNPREQVKSADPVTYDNDGNVIPLSERFNKKNDDMRYFVNTNKNTELFKQYEQGKITREQYQAEVKARLYGDKRQSAVGETRDQNGLDSNVETLENESLIEDPSTGPEPDSAEITVAYMNGRVAPTGIQKAIESIADKLGVKLEFAEFYNADGSKAEHINGYETDDGRVVVNVFSKRQVSFIFKHELTHTLKYSKGYKLFKELVLSSTAFKEWATKKAGVSSGAEATAILAQRAVESRTGLTIKGVDNATVNESDIDGRDEVLGDFIAENCFGMDDESAIKALRALVTANRNVFVRLADKVSQLLDKLRGTQYDMSLRQIERRFRRVLNEKDSMSSSKSDAAFSAESKGIPNQPLLFGKMYNEAMSDHKINRLYNEAKNGNDESAIELIESVIDQRFVDRVKNQYPGCYLVAVAGIEGNTKNVLPELITEYIFKQTGLKIFERINKVSKNNMKQKNTAQRLHEKIIFDTDDDNVYNNIKGKHFVIVDDTVSTGTTINALARFIESAGGTVEGAISLFKGQDSYTNLAITDEQIQQLERRYGRENVEQFIREHGFANTLEQLTSRQAEQLIRTGVFYERGSGQNRTSETRKSQEGDRRVFQETPGETDEIDGADSIDEPAFSMPKTDTKINLSVEADLSADEIREQLKNGKITVDEAMDAMQNLYGAITKGELASRDIDVPMQTSDGKYTRRFARTVLESEHLTDEQVSDVSEDLINEVLSYVPVGNEQAVKDADASIENGTAEEEWKRVVYGDSDWASKEKIVIGERLLIQAAKDGDKARVCQLVAEIAEVGTRAGQVVQALSVLKRMNGAGQLMYVKRVVDRVNENLKKRFGTDKSTGQPKKQLKINDTLAVQLVNAKGESEVDTATKELMKDLGEQMPSTFIDKWNAWRYLSMLGNLRTHIRNLAGNAVFIPAIKCKNILAKAIEYVLPVEQRTKSVVVKKEYRDFAAKNFDAVYDILTGNGKQNPSDAIRDNAKVFKTRWLENLRKLNFNALELEDAMFLKLHYVSALAGYLQAQKVDLSNIDDATLQKAQLYAIEEAQKATYRDASAVASTLSKLSKQNMMANALVEGVLPFKKTPVNILKRSVEYSPIGLMKAVTFNVYALKKGDITASQFVDALAGGLTGTGISILGFFLASLGMLRGPLGWGDKEDEFEELYGEQGYSTVIGDMSFTIDWMAPSCVPLFIGSELYNMLDAENTNIFDASVDAMANLIGPVFEMSMLDGINDTIKSVRFSDNPTAALIPEMLSSYAGQAIPTMSGQIARTIDDTRRTTYYDATSGIPKTVQKAWQRLANKLPGISYFSPEYIDAFGQTERKETASDWIEAAAENFILPGYIGHTDKDSVYHGLKAVESEEALPSKIKDNFINVRSVDENNKKSTEKRYLTADEYEKYQTQYGKMSKQYLFDLIENPKYDSVDDAVKTKAIKILYEYSKEVAKKSVFDEHVYSAKKYARWQQCEEVGVSIADLALVEALFLDEKDNEENKKSDKVIYQEIAQEFVDDKNEQWLLVQINNAKSRDNADTIINRIIENYNN